MKRLCTASSALISLTKDGFHTVLQYSRNGLTYVLNAEIKEESSLDRKHLIMRLALLCALQHIVETWDENFNLFLSNVTPRSVIYSSACTSAVIPTIRTRRVTLNSASH